MMKHDFAIGGSGCEVHREIFDRRELSLVGAGARLSRRTMLAGGGKPLSVSRIALFMKLIKADTKARLAFLRPGQMKSSVSGLLLEEFGMSCKLSKA